MDKPIALKDRQVEVLKLWVSGLSAKQVAEALHIGDSTVDYHLTLIKKRLRLQDKALITKWAIRNGHTEL